MGPQREKSNPLTCAPNEDSNQPACLRNLIRVFVVRMKELCILGYPKCTQWRFLSDCANAQADLNLRWTTCPKDRFRRLRFNCFRVARNRVHCALTRWTWMVADYNFSLRKITKTFEPTRLQLCQAETQIRLRICAVWSESSLFAWRRFGSLATRTVSCKDSGQTAQMHRLIRVFPGRSSSSLVASETLCRGPFVLFFFTALTINYRDEIFSGLILSFVNLVSVCYFVVI